MPERIGNPLVTSAGMRHKYMTLSTGDRCAKLWHSNDIYHKRNQWVTLSKHTFMVSITWIATAARISLQNVTLIETGLWAQFICSRKDNSIEFNSISIFNFQFTLIETRFWVQLICSRKDRTALTANFLALCHFLSSVQLMHYYAYIHFIFTLLLALRILTSWQLLRFGILPFLFLIFSS